MVSCRPHFPSLNQTGDQHSGASCPIPGAQQQKLTCQGRLRSPPWAATAGSAPVAVCCGSWRDTRKPQSPPHRFLSAEQSREALIPHIPPPVPIGTVPHVMSPLTVSPAVGQPRVPAAPACCPGVVSRMVVQACDHRRLQLAGLAVLALTVTKTLLSLQRGSAKVTCPRAPRRKGWWSSSTQAQAASQQGVERAGCK